jgi:hypothetical protein
VRVDPATIKYVNAWPAARARCARTGEVERSGNPFECPLQARAVANWRQRNDLKRLERASPMPVEEAEIHQRAQIRALPQVEGKGRSRKQRRGDLVGDLLADARQQLCELRDASRFAQRVRWLDSEPSDERRVARKEAHERPRPARFLTGGGVETVYGR